MVLVVVVVLWLLLIKTSRGTVGGVRVATLESSTSDKLTTKGDPAGVVGAIGSFVGYNKNREEQDAS